MSTLPDALINGYRQFRSTRYLDEAARYDALGEGQSPETMIIACADSRVDPATIFNAAPGELFVVRNVANLVPPWEAAIAGLHGTSAALEFAIGSLKIKNIVVMGHGGCGGVAASLSAGDNKPIGQFIAPWVELLNPARDALPAHDDKQTALEHGGIKLSIENLKTFPFVVEAVQKGTLALHGAWFMVKTGELHWLDQQTGEFDTVTV